MYEGVEVDVAPLEDLLEQVSVEVVVLVLYHVDVAAPERLLLEAFAEVG